MSSIIKTEMLFCGQRVVLSCDGDCDHAWGINWHGGKEDTAPTDPGTYEGLYLEAKPLDKVHNRWCARECERSDINNICIT